MKLSTKSHCAITAMLQMALPQRQKPISLLKLSKCQKVSLSYLEQILAQLRQHGLIKGLRGPGGGYLLAKRATEINIGEVVEAVGEFESGRWNTSMVQEAYVGVSDEARGHWNALSEHLHGLLVDVNLSELVASRVKEGLWQEQGKKPGQDDSRNAA